MSNYPKPRLSARKRVLKGVKAEDRGYTSKCWIWQGELDRDGYGRIKDKGVRRQAHHILMPPVPDGFEIDHLCKQRACVRPDHLEFVTHAENIRRKNDTTGTDIGTDNRQAEDP